VIIVVNPAEIRKLQMAGQRSGFAGHAFHEIAVPANGVYIKVKDLEAGLVEICSEPLTGDRHSDAIAGTLSERSRGRFYASGDVRFRMARSFASDLAESLDFVHGNGQRI
jgi:hypothetical protein